MWVVISIYDIENREFYDKIDDKIRQLGKEKCVDEVKIGRYCG